VAFAIFCGKKISRRAIQCTPRERECASPDNLDRR
jgi:hypothetical protein